MKRITVDLEDDQYERLRLAAYTERCSVSEAVRKYLALSPPPATMPRAVSRMPEPVKYGDHQRAAPGSGCELGLEHQEEYDDHQARPGRGLDLPR